MNESDLRISPMVRLELQMLHQKNRIEHPFKLLSSLKRDFYFEEDQVNLSKLITHSLGILYTRDPFDRLIVAQATLRNSKLITKDKELLENFKGAVW